MKNRNYKVRRDNVYVGDVCGINPEEIRVIHEKRIKFDVWKKFYSEERYGVTDIEVDGKPFNK